MMRRIKRILLLKRREMGNVQEKVREKKREKEEREERGRLEVAKANEEGKHPNISLVTHCLEMFDCYIVSPRTKFR